MQKNVAGQKWVVFAFDETDNTPVTGDAANITGNLRLDGGAANAIDDTNPTELEDGYYIFDITQAESNADLILIAPASSTVDVQVIGVPGAVWTRPPNFVSLGIESDGDLTKVNTLDGHTAQTADHTAGIADIPTVAEFNARTLVAADYFDPAADTVANVTTCATNTDMRGTDSAALASVCTEARLSELAAANLPTDIDTLLTRIVGTLLAGNHNPQTGDGFAIVNNGTYGNSAIETLVDELESRLTAARAGYLDELAAANLPTDIDTLLTRIVGTLLAGNHTAQTGDSFARIGANGAGLTAQPWNASWDAEVQSEVNDALVALYLDHLFAVDYDPAIKPGVATALLNELVENDGGISRYTANALEQAPSGGTNPNVLVDTTIAVVTDQTHFTLTAGSDVDDTYNDQAIVLYDASNSDFPSVRKITAYTGATKTVTIDSAPDFTILAGDGVKVFVTAPGTTAPTAAEIVNEWETQSQADPTGFHVNVMEIEGLDATDQIRDSASPYVGLQGGLLLNFRINEKTGDFIYDKLHSLYKGVLDADVTFVEGVKGKALDFKGTDYVICRQWWEETKYAGNPVITEPSTEKALYCPCIIDVDDEIWMYYSVIMDVSPARIRTALSISKDGGYTFEFYGYVLEPSPGEWDENRAYHVSVFYDSDDSLFKMWYCGDDDNLTSEIGYAYSSDGKVWTKYAGNPVFVKGAGGDFDDYSVFTPSVLKEGSTYYMFYTGSSDYLVNEGMGLASSSDGTTWTRVQTTPVLAGLNYNKFKVIKYDGVYYAILKLLYDADKLYVAYSTDRINWTINVNTWIEIDSESWGDCDAIGDAGWYSLDDDEARIYYSASSVVRTDDQIGLITLSNFTEKVTKAEILNQYPISICCWVKTTDSGAGRGIIKKGTNNAPLNAYNMYISSGRLKAFYSLDASNYVSMAADIDDGGIINDGEWHHVIFTVDASGGAIFVDTVEMNTAAWVGTPGAITNNETMKLGIYTNVLTGQIDDVRIYDHVLSSAEIRGIYMGVPVEEDNTWESILLNEEMSPKINSVKVTTDKLDDTLELDGAIYRFTENAVELAPSGSLSGSNAITINIKDQNSNDVVECSVEIWDSTNTTYYERKSTNSSGNTSHNIDDGTYTIRIHKAGYTFENQTLVVSAEATENYSGTTILIGTPASVDACRVYEYVFMQDGVTPVTNITALAKIVSLPEDSNGILHLGNELQATYDSSTGLLYWDIVKGSEVEFQIFGFGINVVKTVPSSVTVRLTDMT